MTQNTPDNEREGNPQEPRNPGTEEAMATRIEEYAHDADFGWVADSLMARRDDVINRWLEATAKQPFHAGHKGRAVADHIPHLFDALVGLLYTTSPSWIEARAPLENIGILAAAQSHARVRAEQGLSSADVVVEFRLLRQEIWRALRSSLPDTAPTDDVLAAEMLVNDALDGAITQGLGALSSQVEQVREEFLATTMHDIRQPLTSISGEAQLLIRTLARPEPDLSRVKASAERIQGSVKRMISMLETLTDMSKVALGSLDLRRSPTDLETILRGALAHCSPAEIARVTFAIDEQADLRGEWDGARLERVADNLFGNAFKYSAGNAPVLVRLSGDSDNASFSIRDNGIGILPEDIAHVFSRYRRGSNVIEQGVEGSGLGLYLSQGIVEAHGGRIWAESAGPGTGTTITVVLPKHASDEPQTQ